MSVFEDIGLRRVINASGRMTYLGVSTISDTVAKNAIDAAQHYVVMDELVERAGQIISQYTGAEDGLPTSCASAGIAISVAGLITKGKKSLVERMPESTGLANEIVLQKGHSVNFGVPLTTVIRIGGGVPIEVGSVNKSEPTDIEEAISEKTVCLFYCKSHHSVQKGMTSLEQMIAIAHSHALPILVDAAAEEDFRKYISMGADLVVYSGAKALEATTSGFIAGNKTLIGYCRQQNKGIGRVMKVGKEQIIGLLTALGEYEKKDHQKISIDNLRSVEELNNGINKIPYCHATVMQDEAGRSIYRSKVTFDKECGKTAFEISEILKKGNPSIYCRPNLLNIGVMVFDPRPLTGDDVNVIVARLKEILGNSND